MTPAQLRALLDAATKRPWRSNYDTHGIQSEGSIASVAGEGYSLGGSGGIDLFEDIDAIVATMNAADALVALWAALRSTGYTYRPDSEDPVERRIADALRRLEELP